MWLLKRNKKDILGRFSTCAKAVAVLIKTREKEDGTTLSVEPENKSDVAKQGAFVA